MKRVIDKLAMIQSAHKIEHQQLLNETKNAQDVSAPAIKKADTIKKADILNLNLTAAQLSLLNSMNHENQEHGETQAKHNDLISRHAGEEIENHKKGRTGGDKRKSPRPSLVAASPLTARTAKTRLRMCSRRTLHMEHNNDP